MQGLPCTDIKSFLLHASHEHSGYLSAAVCSRVQQTCRAKSCPAATLSILAAEEMSRMQTLVGVETASAS